MNIFQKKYDQIKYYFGQGYKIIVEKNLIVDENRNYNCDVLDWFKDNDIPFTIRFPDLPRSKIPFWAYKRFEIEFQYKKDLILFRMMI